MKNKKSKTTQAKNETLIVNTTLLNHLIVVKLQRRWRDDKLTEPIFQEAAQNFQKQFNVYHDTWKSKRVLYAAFPVNEFPKFTEIVSLFMKEICSDFYTLTVSIPSLNTVCNVINTEYIPVVIAPAKLLGDYTMEKHKKELADSCPSGHKTLKIIFE